MLKKMVKYILTGIIALIVGYSFFYIITEKIAKKIETPTIIDPAQMPEVIAIPVNSEFNEGFHTYEGIITLPNPCLYLDSKATVLDVIPQQVQINFYTIPTSDICEQQTVEKYFSLSFQADENAVVDMFINKKPVAYIEILK